MSTDFHPRPSICPAGGAHHWLLQAPGETPPRAGRCKKCGEYDGTVGRPTLTVADIKTVIMAAFAEGAELLTWDQLRLVVKVGQLRLGNAIRGLLAEGHIKEVRPGVYVPAESGPVGAVEAEGSQPDD